METQGRSGVARLVPCSDGRQRQCSERVRELDCGGRHTRHEDQNRHHRRPLLLRLEDAGRDEQTNVSSLVERPTPGCTCSVSAPGGSRSSPKLSHFSPLPPSPKCAPTAQRLLMPQAGFGQPVAMSHSLLRCWVATALSRPLPLRSRRKSVAYGGKDAALPRSNHSNLFMTSTLPRSAVDDPRSSAQQHLSHNARASDHFSWSCLLYHATAAKVAGE